MNSFCLRVAAAAFGLTWATLLSGQTTKPAGPVTWSGTVEQVARATEKGDVPLVVAALGRDATVRSFETAEPAAARTLIDAAVGWKLLGAHGYEFPPASLAVDIADDVRGSDLVSEAQKRKIIPLDDAEAARANATAGDWVARTLAAERNHLVGVAVFWDVAANRPVFILMKGDYVRGSYEVKLAVYGDPMMRAARAPAR